MTKKLAALLMIMFVFAGLTYAQVSVKGEHDEHNISQVASASATGNAKIKVFANLDVTQLNANGQGLDFGNVPTGVTATIDANTSKNNAAEFKFSGVPGADLDITTPSSITMKNGSNSLTVDHIQAVYSTDQNGQSGATASLAKKLNQDGDLYLWIGGQVQVPSGQAQGSYTGDFTVSVAYTNY